MKTAIWCLLMGASPASIHAKRAVLFVIKAYVWHVPQVGL